MTVRRALAVVGWTLVVVLCSTAVWGVIRTAGTGVTSAREVPDATVGLPPSDTPTPSRSPTARPHPHHHRHHHSHRAGPTPGAATPAAPTPGGTTQPGRPADSASPRTQPTEVRRTWQGDAGAVVAGCQGPAITFRGAQANSGWRVEVGNRGPEQVDVQFTGRDDDTAGAVHVTARCAGGEPRFSTGGDD